MTADTTNRIIAEAIAQELNGYCAVTNGFENADDLNDGFGRMQFEDLDGDTASEITGVVIGALTAAGFQIVPIEVAP